MRRKQLLARLSATPGGVLVLGVIRRFTSLRVTGLAAEMAYFALLSLSPVLVALGSSLGFVERFVGAGEIEQIETVFVDALGAVFSTDVTQDILAPLVQSLLQQERAGFALGGFLVALFLAGRVFRAAIRALDMTFGVEERRSGVVVWPLGMAFALGAVITITVILSLVVVGPLLGGGHAIARWIGVGELFELIWVLARWPIVFALGITYLASLYRLGPNRKTRWRHCLLGGAVGTTGMILVAVGFRVYLEVVGAPGPDVIDADEAVRLGAQVVGAILAVLLWCWLTCVALLSGGVLSAELEVSRLRTSS